MPTDEQKRAAAARRAREYRARKRSAVEQTRSAKVSAGPAPTTMRDAVEGSLLAMKWITDSDAASVAQAKLLAKQVDELEHAGDTVRSLSAHRALSRVLNDLAATPAARLQHELRSLKSAAKQDGGDDGGKDEDGAAGNVSKFERPAKRRRG